MAVGCACVALRIFSFFLLLNPTKTACGLQYGFDQCLGNVLKPFMDFNRQSYFPNCLNYNYQHSRRVVRRFSRIRTPQTLWTKHGHLCLWLLGNSLCHDLTLALRRRNRCVLIAVSLFGKLRRPFCVETAPQSCFHAKCSGLTKDAFNKRNTSTEQWLCLACSLPQISDPFFESSSSSLNFSDPETGCSGTQSSETFGTLTRGFRYSVHPRKKDRQIFS